MIITIGHGTKSPGEFEAMLNLIGVNHVVDIRSLPGSRRYPHFNQENMRDWVSYSHLPALGGHRRPTNDGYETVRNKGFRGYCQYTETEYFAAGIEELLDIESQYNTIAIMCAETLWWRCHRSIVAEYLAINNLTTVKHYLNGLVDVGPRLLSE